MNNMQCTKTIDIKNIHINVHNTCDIKWQLKETTKLYFKSQIAGFSIFFIQPKIKNCA